MIEMIIDIVKHNNIIGKGTFGKIYHFPEIYPNYVVKRMNKYNKYGNNLVLNNVKELWWYSFISNIDIPHINSVNSDSNLSNEHNKIENINYDNVNVNNIPKMISYHVDNNYIYVLIQHKGRSITSFIKELFINKQESSNKQEKGDKKDNGNNDKYFNTHKYQDLLKKIPIILYSCSKVLLQLQHSFIRHGDITISNIMLNENETNDLSQVSVIDWGSLVFHKLSINYYNQCAKEFIAPELLKDELCDNDCTYDKPSVKSDVYSLGVVLLYILDPHKYFLNSLNLCITDSKCNDNMFETVNQIIKDILDKYKQDFNINIEEFVDADILYLIERMLDTNMENRIDIESIYMHEHFKEYRMRENNYDKLYIKKCLRKQKEFNTDICKNIFVEYTYQFLKKFKNRSVFKSNVSNNSNNHNNSYYTNNSNSYLSKRMKLIDTRIILAPSIQLFYLYLTRIHYFTNTDNYQHTEIQMENNDNSKTKMKNINHYIITFMCCIKWIDILSNDDISIYYLYELYSLFYKLLKDVFIESIELDLNNYLTLFDLTFFEIFKRIGADIYTYIDVLDYKYQCIDFSEIKKYLRNL